MIIMGDLNTSILSNKFSRNLNIHSQHLLKFLADNNMMYANTLQLCTGASSSYVSYDGSSESLIDHILFPVDNIDLVSRCEICDDDALNVSNTALWFVKTFLYRNLVPRILLLTPELIGKGPMTNPSMRTS